MELGMMSVGNCPGAIGRRGSGVFKSPIPGTFLIRSFRSLAFFSQSRATCLLHMPIKSPFADRLDMLFQAGALVEHKDIADFLLFGASIPLCNRFVEETASFFGDFGFSIAS